MGPRISRQSAVLCGLGTLHCLAACTASTDDSAQARLAIERLPLASANERIFERFTSVGDLVEVDDSLVLVNDVPEQSVWMVDFSSGSRAPFGRSGDGPGEYRSPASILRLGGDTIVIASTGPEPRLALLSTSGVPLGTHTLELPRVAASAASDPTFDEWPPQPAAYDGRGYIYGVRPRTPVGLEPLPPEQERQVLIRFNISLSRFDTIAEVRPAGVYRGRLVAGRLEYDLPLGPFEVSDVWGVLSDGTVIIVDEQAYTLTVYPERGETSASRPVAHSTRPLASAEWQQFVDSARGALLEMFTRGPSMAGGLSSSQVRVPEAPTSFPPVAADRTRRLLNDGDMLWIPVNRDVANAHSQWDVLRADGTVFARYEMPPNVRLVAVSNRYFYTVETSEDELQLLTRSRRSGSAAAGEPVTLNRLPQ